MNQPRVHDQQTKNSRCLTFTVFKFALLAWGLFASNSARVSSADPPLSGMSPAVPSRFEQNLSDEPVNDAPKDFEQLSKRFSKDIGPLIVRMCTDCHGHNEPEGDLDLNRFAKLEQIRTDPQVWHKVREQVESREMPPKDSTKLTEEQRQQMLTWLNEYLHREAMAGAGDPGPVILRRLSNAEYTYTIADLTGLNRLSPAEEFPVDGAAGEGFTNVGAGLVMSPALFSKYLKAAKDIAQHVVMLPDGIAFSEKLSRRDQTAEALQNIKAFYAQHTISGGKVARNLQGVQLQNLDAGVVDLQPYISATIQYRNSINAGKLSLDQVADIANLNSRYLNRLWQELNSEQPSLVLDPIRRKWRNVDAANATDSYRDVKSDVKSDAKQIVESIADWQKSLWRFTPVGHIGKRDGPIAWQEPISPLAHHRQFQIPLSDTGNTSGVHLYLITSDAGDGHANDVVRWRRPRIISTGLPVIGLQQAQTVAEQAELTRSSELGKTSDYLLAIVEAKQKSLDLDTAAKLHNLDPTLLIRWQQLLILASPSRPQIRGHLTERLTNVGGYDDIRGWGLQTTPSVIANRADNTYQFSTLTVPGRSVMVHPSPDSQAVVYWQSPLAGAIQVRGEIADGDGNCGNGVGWGLTLFSERHVSGKLLVGGKIDNGQSSNFRLAEDVEIQADDFLALTVDPRDRQHVCDTTRVNLKIQLQNDPMQTWDLAKDIVDRIDQSNPLPDTHGNQGVWHFGAAPLDSNEEQKRLFDGTALQKLAATLAGEALLDQATIDGLFRETQQIEDQFLAPKQADENTQDAKLAKHLQDWRGPLGWLELAVSKTGLSQEFPDITTTPGIKEYQIPDQFMGSEFVCDVALNPQSGKNGSVQVQVTLQKPTDLNRDATGLDPGPGIQWESPILVSPDSETEQSITQQLATFRTIFPSAMCYTKIVPVDEVVTLTLYYREDHHLQHLMLTPEQAKQLDELWQRLHFISQDALKQVDAFEQLWQFATQDADPSAFEPMRVPILQRAERFRETLKAAEVQHLNAIENFAARAWRYRNTSPDAGRDAGELPNKIDNFYASLRTEGLDHGDAIRLTLARVFVAPEFLYKLERPGSGTQPTTLSNAELAARLSYFLWSSIPDKPLNDALVFGNSSAGPQRQQILVHQAERMIQDAKVERLAEHFACQWLGVRDFDQLDEKSETHFPEFRDLRGSMNEEVVRFFTDFFQNDRSILSILSADHTYVDAKLATFYEVPYVSPPENPVSRIPSNELTQVWTRVQGMRDLGRGGVLGMAAPLARQAGASRSSPILRGNWVFEVLLGQHLPKPPKNVPLLPDSLPAGLTERELTEMHSKAPECAKCHEKIDGFGFSLEAFDAIGRSRAGGDTRAVLADGSRLDGTEGLREYLLEQRRDQFVQQFCRKLLGYALGRSVMLSDQPLLDTMLHDLQQNEFRVSVAIKHIVTSSQFNKIRGAAAQDHLTQSLDQQ